MRKVLKPCLFVAAFLTTPIFGEVTEPEALLVLTESTPFTIEKSNEERGGEATALVKKTLNNAALNYQLSYVPWKRSYQYAKLNKNVLIYPIARTAQREQDFIWVGKIIPISYFLFKLSSRKDIKLNSISDTKNYRIGVVNHHAHHEYLLNKGFKNFQLVNNNQQNLKKLLLGRIDLFPMSSGGLKPLCMQSLTDCGLLTPAFALEDFSDGLYMALSKNSDPELVERIQQSYLNLVPSEYYQKLFEERLAQATLVENLGNTSEQSSP